MQDLPMSIESGNKVEEQLMNILVELILQLLCFISKHLWQVYSQDKKLFDF